MKRSTRRTGHLTKGHAIQTAAGFAAASLFVGFLAVLTALFLEARK